jgi:hypothetical protein
MRAQVSWPEAEALLNLVAVRFPQKQAQGWVDAWRSRHRQGRDYSWFSAWGIGFRYDNALASAGLDRRIRSFRHAQELRQQGLSDHAELVLALGRTNRPSLHVSLRGWSDWRYSVSFHVDRPPARNVRRLPRRRYGPLVCAPQPLRQAGG